MTRVIILLTIFHIMIFTNSIAQNNILSLENIGKDNWLKIEKMSSVKDVVKITDKRSGLIRYKNIGEITQIKKGGVDTTKIDITNINDSLYNLMYRFWFDTDISGQSFQPSPIEDINNNGNAEIYGHIFEVYYGREIANDFVIFEFNPSLETFDSVYTFEREGVGGYCGGVHDINGNGRKQICYINIGLTDSVYTQASNYYKNETENDLPTILDFQHIEHNQTNNHRYGDFNKDGVVEQIYFIQPYVQISQYNSAINNMELVYEYALDGAIEYYGEGFSTEDIDGDGYPELVFGGMNGGLFVFEYQPEESQYELVYHEEDVGTYNVYLHFSTQDIDDNGKNEFWIGGDAFYNGQGITRFTCYEATGDNQYEPVHRIDIYNLFSWYAGNMFPIDIDKDGKEEIFMCVDQNILIFKFTGSPNNPSYELYYHWRNPKANDEDWGLIYGARMYDLDHDGYEEIIINGKSSTRPEEGFGKVESYVYKPTELVSADENHTPESDFNLRQNYPNPFNPTTRIRYEIPSESFVKLSAFNILGEKVCELVNEKQRKGTYEEDFDGRGLPSGVYFIKLSAKTNFGMFEKTIKALLIK